MPCQQAHVGVQLLTVHHDRGGNPCTLSQQDACCCQRDILHLAAAFVATASLHRLSCSAPHGTRISGD